MAVRGVAESERIGAAVKTLLNIIWLVLAGIWLVLGMAIIVLFDPNTAPPTGPFG